MLDILYLVFIPNIQIKSIHKQLIHVLHPKSTTLNLDSIEP